MYNRICEGALMPLAALLPLDPLPLLLLSRRRTCGSWCGKRTANLHKKHSASRRAGRPHHLASALGTVGIVNCAQTGGHCTEYRPNPLVAGKGGLAVSECVSV